MIPTTIDKMPLALMLSSEELNDRLKVMIQQEEYQIMRPWFLAEFGSPNKDEENGGSKYNFIPEIETHESWRSKICMWMYTVVDHFQFSREIVAIAISIFDRYLFNCYNNLLKMHNNHNELNPQRSVMTARNCQLVSVASLHIALKMKESSRVHYLPTLLSLSRNFFTSEHVTTMEMSILESLEWKLCRPTSQEFLDHFIVLLSNSSDVCITRDIGDFAQYLVELSVCDFHFTRHNFSQSSIALACLFNSIDVSKSSSADLRKIAATQAFLKRLEIIEGLTPRGVLMRDIQQCQCRLEELYKAQLANDEVEEGDVNRDDYNESSFSPFSPVTVVESNPSPSSSFIYPQQETCCLKLH